MNRFVNNQEFKMCMACKEWKEIDCFDKEMYEFGVGARQSDLRINLRCKQCKSELPKRRLHFCGFVITKKDREENRKKQTEFLKSKMVKI